MSHSLPRLLGLFTAFFLVLAALTAQAAQAADTGSITAKVYVKDVGGSATATTGGYIYYYYSADGQDYSSAIGKDFDGAGFTLSNLAPGYYKFEVAGTTPSGYQREFYNDGYNQDDATAIHVAAGQSVTTDDMVLERPGQISGTVRDADGAPLANASVFFERPGNGGAFGVQTDAQGRYSSADAFSEGLVKGDYYVNASKHPENPADPAYLGAYWPSSADKSGGDVVTVVPGKTKDSIDFNLAISPRITLTVKDPDGKPMPGLPVGIYLPDENGVWGPIQSGPHETDANGVYRMDRRVGSSFKFKVTPPAELDGAVAEWYDNAYNIDDATAVELTQPGQRADITIQFGAKPSVQAGTPSISGTPQVGATLTASPGTWEPSGVELAYQWAANGVTIKNATGKTYVPVASDVGKTLTVTVTGSLADHAPASATSQPTTAVAAADDGGANPIAAWLSQLLQWLRDLLTP